MAHTKNNGEYIKIKRTDEGMIYFYINEEYLKKYGLGLDTFRNREPFKADIFDDLLDRAIKEYGAELSRDALPRNICVEGSTVIFEVREKSNIVYLDNEYVEEENIVNGIWELFRTLPDEAINMGIINVDKKRELLKLIRSENGIEYIREYFMS